MNLISYFFLINPGNQANRAQTDTALFFQERGAWRGGAEYLQEIVSWLMGSFSGADRRHEDKDTEIKQLYF